jgi:hypothetical protein
MVLYDIPYQSGLSHVGCHDVSREVFMMTCRNITTWILLLIVLWTWALRNWHVKGGSGAGKDTDWFGGLSQTFL